jgi:hypothetical protein
MKKREWLFIIMTFPVAFMVRLLVDTKWKEKCEKIIPYRPRFLNYIWALYGGYFWLPCPLCSKNFSGHEWTVLLSTSYTTGIGVCPKCIIKAEKLNKMQYTLIEGNNENNMGKGLSWI